MMRYKVISTPAVAIDGELALSGSVPEPARIERWLKERANAR